MILSKLILDWKSLKSLSIKGPYGIHKLVYSMFPGDKRSFLYYENLQSTHGKEILILSKVQPALPNFGLLQSKTVPENFLESDTYAFQIMLNTVKRNHDGKLVPIIGKEEARQWFLNKEESWGFTVNQNSFEVVDSSVQVVEKGIQSITQTKAIFRGLLNVIDKSVFKQSFENGIGRGKAFGFGMLQLQKIK
ncbi:MAG: type I-E CRISPR-associated protein Cas6/Cse3/CasE [Sphaerochaetaceae bacterium]|nr:type I-E CRISPR-associated protein Cas6/Cse3/CasE [Sphaerochaetaceae bacterium]